jgi:CHAT domain-containing protein
MQLHQQQTDKGYNLQAFQISERSRARSLLDLLSESQVDIRTGVAPNLLERERSLRQMLADKAEHQVKLLNTKATEEQKLEVEKALNSLTAEYQQVQAQIRAQSPAYAALTQPSPLSLTEVQRRVLDDKSLLLQYSLGEKRSYLWAITPTTVNSYELPAEKEIESAALRVYDLLTARQHQSQETIKQYQTRVVQADAEYASAVRALSQMLLGPVAGELAEKRLVIVPDGALQYIPFAALFEPESIARSVVAQTHLATGNATEQPLIVRHELVSLPSASTLAILRQETEKRAPLRRAIAILADPVFEANDSRLRNTRNKQLKTQSVGKTKTALASQRSSAKVLLSSSSGLPETPLKAGKAVGEESYNLDTRVLRGVRRERGNLARLLFSRKEAVSIAAQAPGGQTLLAMDFEANLRQASNEQLSQYRYVHFATHGILNENYPELSGIVLSLVDESGNSQDGFLGLSEIYNLHLPAEMVVLSACQTALGKKIKGEGLIGLTRGFMYAGAKRVMASLWSVEDRATAELMERMYTKVFKDREQPAAALRKAQLEILTQKEWHVPYYWAGFVLQGEWLH